MDDGSLLAQYADHADASAFAELVRRHGAMVQSAARRLAREDADDVAQAAFILLAQKAAALRNRDSVAGWLYETTRLCARNARRARARRTKHLATLQETTMTASTPIAAAPEWADVLDDALARLPRNEREVVLLRYLEGFTLAETAGRLASTPAAVAKRAERAIGRMRSYFRGRGYVVSAEQAAAGLLSLAVPLPTGGLPVAPTIAPPGASQLANTALKAMAVVKWKAAAVIALAAVTVVAVASIAVVAMGGAPTKLSPPARSPVAAAPLTTTKAPPPATAPASQPAVTLDEANRTADAFLKALADNDASAVIGLLDGPAPIGRAGQLLAEVRQGRYARYPQRLTQRVGMNSVNMNGTPESSTVEVAAPTNAEIEHLQITLVPRGGQWRVTTAKMVSDQFLGGATSDLNRKPGTGDKYRKAQASWQAWAGPMEKFATGEGPTEKDKAEVLAAMRSMRSDLPKLADALSDTEFKLSPTDLEKVGQSLDAMAGVLEREGMAAMSKSEVMAKIPYFQRTSELFSLRSRLSELAAGEEEADRKPGGRPPAVEPDREVKLPNGETWRWPGPLAFPDWLKQSPAYKTWEKVGDIRTFVTRDDAGNTYVVPIMGRVKEADGTTHAVVREMRQYRADGTLARTTEDFGHGQRNWTWVDATGKRYQWKAFTQADENEKERLSEIRRFDADGVQHTLHFDDSGKPSGEVMFDPIGAPMPKRRGKQPQPVR